MRLGGDDKRIDSDSDTLTVQSSIRRRRHVWRSMRCSEEWFVLDVELSDSTVPVLISILALSTIYRRSLVPSMVDWSVVLYMSSNTRISDGGPRLR